MRASLTCWWPNACASVSCYYSYSGRSVGVLFGNGDGTFQAAKSYASAVVTLTFLSNSVPSGATHAPLKVGGTYSVTSPYLNGNWTLSFRRLTL